MWGWDRSLLSPVVCVATLYQNHRQPASLSFVDEVSARCLSFPLLFLLTVVLSLTFSPPQSFFLDLLQPSLVATTRTRRRHIIRVCTTVCRVLFRNFLFCFCRVAYSSPLLLVLYSRFGTVVTRHQWRSRDCYFRDLASNAFNIWYTKNKTKKSTLIWIRIHIHICISKNYVYISRLFATCFV